MIGELVSIKLRNNKAVPDDEAILAVSVLMKVYKLKREINCSPTSEDAQISRKVYNCHCQ